MDYFSVGTWLQGALYVAAAAALGVYAHQFVKDFLPRTGPSAEERAEAILKKYRDEERGEA